MDAGSIPAASTKNQYNLPMKAFLINLEKAEERLNSCVKEFKKISLNYVLVKAVDGEKNLPSKKEFSRFFYTLKHGKRVNPREVACYQSHIKALELFVETSEEYALICEDDIEFSDDFVDVVSQSLKSPIKFDILRLSGSEDKRREKGMPLRLLKLSKDFYLSLNFSYKPIAACYLLNKKAAKSILKKMKKMHLPYDFALDRDWLLGVRSLTICPSLVNLKEELHMKNSFIKASHDYKLNTFIRIWSVVPYRFYLEIRRLIYKTTLLLKIKVFKV